MQAHGKRADDSRVGPEPGSPESARSSPEADTPTIAPGASPKRARGQGEILSLIQQLVKGLGQAQDLESVYQEAQRGVVEILGCRRAGLLMAAQDTGTAENGGLVAVFGQGLPASFLRAAAEQLPWSPGDEAPEPLLLGDLARAAEGGGLAAAARREKLAALACYPLVQGGALLGGLLLAYDGPRTFEEHERRLALIISDHIALATSRLRSELALRAAQNELEERVEKRLSLLKDQISRRKEAEEALRKESARIQLLQEMGHTVTSEFDRRVIFQEVLAKLMELLGAHGVFVLLLQGDELVFAASSQSGEDDPTGRRIPAGTGVAGEVLASGQALALFGEAVKGRIFADFVRALGYRPGALLAAPLRLRGRIIGVLEAMHRASDGFEEGDLKILESAASWTAIAVQNARLFQELRASREHLRRLARQVVTAQEVERRRISRELHDEAGQALTALKINLAMIQAGLPEELSDKRQQLAEAVETTDRTMEQIRRLAHGLHPPVLDKFGLGAAAEGLCDDFAARTPLQVELKLEPLPPLDDQCAISLYRVLQEGLTNAARHAEAETVGVTLGQENGVITLAINDDGRGFDPGDGGAAAQSGMGLAGMQERIELLGGRLEIDSAPGRGTRILARVPVQRQEEET
jgi:signal transduction histidine kinase